MFGVKILSKCGKCTPVKFSINIFVLREKNARHIVLHYESVKNLQIGLYFPTFYYTSQPNLTILLNLGRLFPAVLINFPNSKGCLIGEFVHYENFILSI